MLLSIFIEEIFALTHRLPRLRSSQKLAYGQAEWQAGATLQLQRLAHENVGLGTWSRTDEAIPVTESGETLGVLDISNAKHARLVQSSIEMDRMDAVEGLVQSGIEINRMDATEGYEGLKPRAGYQSLPSREQL